MKQIEMTTTDGLPTLYIPTGETSDDFVMVGKFPEMGRPEITVVQSNGAGGMTPFAADADALLRCLAENLGYTVSKPQPTKRG